MSSINAAAELTSEHGKTLLEIARASIKKGLCGESLKIDVDAMGPALQILGAAFVTLHVDGELRGCIGSLEAVQPLVVDVVQNAHEAAFRDPRFPALTWPEFERLTLHISVLTMPEPMDFDSEENLLQQLRPGVDGLILEEGHRRGTFLPSVWETLSDPREFFAHLKRKAGLPQDYWSDTLRVRRYRTIAFPD
jgi:AmmeMemoRadiSam system protein A